MSNPNSNIYQLKEMLDTNADLPLIFSFEDHTIHPGYHVTEVQHAKVNALDCGNGKDQWEEIIIQLMDGSALFKGEHMSCGKFLGIVGKAIESLSFDNNTQTFIEFAPNNEGLRKLTVGSVEASSGTVVVSLTSPTAMCKPYQRAMAKQSPKEASESCCESNKPKQLAESCCG